MSGSLDLCVLRGGHWEIYNVYSASEEAEAVRDAIDLKSNFRAVVVVDPERMKIIYSHDSGGGKPDFRNIRRDLESDKKKSRTARPSPTPVMRGGGVPKLRDKPATVDQSAPNALVAFFRQVIAAIARLFGLQVARAGETASSSRTRESSTNRGAAGPIPPKKGGDDPEGETAGEDGDAEAQAASTTDDLDKMMALAKEAFWSEKDRQMKGDAHFGIMLYLAGAARKFSYKRGVPADVLSDHLARAMGEIGMQQDLARTSFENIDEFLLQPRNFKMFQRGQAMAKQILKDSRATPDVVEALEGWLNPQVAEAQTEEVSPFLAVLFTDIVNFTASVENKGNDWMKDVLRAHNDIVRSVLESYQGKEVKHTGDGIMSSFKNTDSALRAAIAMQNGFVYFSHKMPQRAFRVRIGLSAGEPVAMDGDLYGGPVNLAARVLPFAEGEDITVSANVADMFSGVTEFAFTEIPDCELKGFDRQSVFKLRWREHKDSNAPASPQESGEAEKEEA